MDLVIEEDYLQSPQIPGLYFKRGISPFLRFLIVTFCPWYGQYYAGKTDA